MHIITRDDLPLTGFAGLKERLYVMSPTQFTGKRLADTSEGLGHLVYLADAFFRPHGSTGEHHHRDIDIVTCLIRGRLLHRGSVGDGHVLSAGDVQVQRAGTTGFAHNEVNPDGSFNHMIQIWFQPAQSPVATDYRVHQPQPGCRTRVYGEASPAAGMTWLDVMITGEDDTLAATVSGPCLGYLVRGTAHVTEHSAGVTGQARMAADTLFQAHDVSIHLAPDSYLLLSGVGR
ncbi:pirin family protein [Alcanivorax sp. JB21]|uniref:pirin family protein n=1 Tax=Alcanivorax limicola TaxID=2874102 RepID=UPI001CC1A785|nr:pirin family protein [Alcanivorax limicola]MBZ2189949.1 pirin family protein [Alcanivorax limicola]